MPFNLQSTYQPTGDQPQAIAALTRGIKSKDQHQVLLGVTGSGKTFTMANVIQEVKKPTLIIAHNKTLAAQLYQEFRDFFPNNAVSYFVSYYDYYQPEAYIPSSDTYIEKDSSINDEIDKLRLASTTNLLTRQDVIVVASVSCIYNLGSPVEYGKYVLRLVEGEVIARETVMLQLSNLQYERSETELFRGSFRVRGDTIQVWPAYEERALRIDTLEHRIERITWIDPISGSPLSG
jgi:excinuclease ABC subunit B